MDVFFELIPPDVWGTDLAIAAATLLAAGLIRGFSGFGSAMINSPVLSLLWGPTIGVPVAVLIEFVPAIQLTRRAIPDAQWRNAGTQACEFRHQTLRVARGFRGHFMQRGFRRVGRNRRRSSCRRTGPRCSGTKQFRGCRCIR